MFKSSNRVENLAQLLKLLKVSGKLWRSQLNDRISIKIKKHLNTLLEDKKNALDEYQSVIEKVIGSEQPHKYHDKYYDKDYEGNYE